jgi:hypothetical protein
MQKIIIFAAGLVLVATSAFGQSSSREREDFGRGGWHDEREGSERGRDFGDWRRRAMRDGDSDHGSSGSGSRFLLRSGDTQLRVVCGDREPTRTCVDAALLMLERVQSQQGSSSRPSAPPNAPQ